MTRPVLLFADRLPPLTGGMEMHARYFIEHFEGHPRHPLLGVVTRDGAGRDCLLRDGRLTPTSLDVLANHLAEPPHIVFFNSGRWIEELLKIRAAFPRAFFVYRTGGNEIIEASLDRTNIGGHRDRQRYWVRALRATVDQIITNSAFTERRLSEVGLDAERFVRCVGGVNVSALRAALRSTPPLRTDPVFFCAARFVPYKNHALLIDVLSALVHRGRHLRLRLAGDGLLFSDVHARAAKSGLLSRIDFLGPLTNEDVCAETALADVYVQLSADRITEVRGGSYVHAEGMGRALLEAISCGTYVIAARAGALPEVVTKERGELVELGSAERIADAFEATLAAPPAKRPFFDGYGWDRYFARYERLWEVVDASARRH